MTKLLEQAIAKARELPDAEQDEAAEVLLSLMSRRDAAVSIDAATRAAIREGMDQARRGEFVADKDMADFFKRHGV